MLGVRVAVGRQADRIELETLQESDFGQACMEAGGVQRWQRGGGGRSHLLVVLFVGPLTTTHPLSRRSTVANIWALSAFVFLPYMYDVHFSFCSY